MKPIEHLALVNATLTRQRTPDFETVGKAYFGRGANEKKPYPYWPKSCSKTGLLE